MSWALLFLLAADGPDARRVRIIARALSYELNLRERSGDTVHVLLVSKPGADASRCEAFYKEFAQLGGVRVQGLPLEVRQRTLATTDAVVAEVKAAPTQVLYLCEGFGADLNGLLLQTRKLRVISVGSTRKHVEVGAGIGVEVDGDKISLLVNKAAAKAEGANYSDQLLKVAIVIE